MFRGCIKNVNFLNLTVFKICPMFAFTAGVGGKKVLDGIKMPSVLRLV